MACIISITDPNGHQRRVSLDKPVIMLGRSRQCDIQLTGDAISTRHAKIRVYRDHATIEDLNSTNGVLVDEVRVHGRTQVYAHSKIQLGLGGPILQIVGGLPGAVHSPAASVKPWYHSRGMLAAAIFGIAALFLIVLFPIILIGGFAIVLPLVSSSDSIDSQQVFKKYGDSVYLVCFRLPNSPEVKPFGTAFPISDDGLFATNAHVVVGIATLTLKHPQITFHVISPGGKTEFKLVEWMAHREYIQNTQDNTPDVGVVKADLSGESLPVVIPLANDRDLKKLGTGSALCYIGYPVFYDSDFGALKKIVPRTFGGNVVRLMNLHDEAAEYKDSVLLEHNMHSWGGASGSPIFGTCGKVVALHFAGGQNIDVDARKATSQQAGIKWGIRIDLLQEVIREFRKKKPT